MDRPTALFVLLILACLNAPAQQEYIAMVNAPAVEVEVDLALLRADQDPENGPWDICDSLANIPWYDAYCEWSTTKIFSKRYDLRDKPDTTELILQYDACDHAHPFCGRITSDFGYRRNRFHYGVDIKLKTGDPVLCAFEGVVRISKYSSTFGRVIVVRHNNGLETLYAHLSKLKVEPGDKVEAGDVIGLGGNTGRSTGSHLHLEVRFLGEPIDPNTVFNIVEGELRSDTLLLNSEHFEYLKEVRARKYHRVRSGDTLSGIGYRYGRSITQLCRLNGIRRSSTLRIGQSIRYN